MQGETTADPTVDFAPGRWTGRWIWAGDGDGSGRHRRHTVALRRDVDLATVPGTAPARLYTNSRHVLYVNGVEVAHGPVRSNPRDGRYDLVDLAPHLRPGTNHLAVLATSYRDATPWFLPPPVFSNDLVEGAFVFECLLPDDDGGSTVVASDETWRAVTLEGWTSTPAIGVSGRGIERVVASSLPADWATADPGESGLDWPPVVVRRAMTTGEPGNPAPPTFPYGPFGPRPISMAPASDVALTARDVTPVGAGGTWRAERIEIGTLVLDAEGPEGAVVRVTASEFVDDTGTVRPDPEHDAVAEFVLDGTRRTLETVDRYGFQGLTVVADDGVTVHAITVRDRSYPVTGDASFRCSDPLLDDVWAAGRRSVTINSPDAYTDCPTREQRAWTGDSVVHQMVDLTTNADWGLARWHPQLAAVPRPDGMLPMAVAGDAEQADFTVIPDWALHWVRSVHNLMRYTGDRELVAALLPVAEGVVRWFDRFDDGTGTPVDVFAWVIIDWSSVYTEGACAALCGLLGRALLDVADMASWLGDAGRVAWATERHARLAAGFERFWDPDRELYVDSVVADVRRPMASQHAQAAALVGRLAPPHRHDRLVEVLTDTDARVWAAFRSPDDECPPNAGLPISGDHLRAGQPEPWWDVDRRVVWAQPFFRYVVHDALVEAGRADLLVDQCRDWAWALERCPTSLTETWYGGTISHGWGATPTRDLMTRVLGVEPAEPGFDVARIRPHLGDLDWAEGRVPTPHGPIAVRVEPGRIVVDSPVPIEVAGTRHEAGQHDLAVAP